jgi:hypothetical protein
MRNETLSLHPDDFLAKIGEGRTISSYGENQNVFSQADSADSVFYTAKKQPSQFSGMTNFAVKDAWPDSPSDSRAQQR